MKKQSDISKLVKQARKSLGLNGESQQELVRMLREKLDLTNEELAAALGKSPALIYGWLAPEGAKKHRKMAEGDKLVLRQILAAKQRKK